MFKKTDPQQKLFGVETQLARGAKARLKASWAQVFKESVLPLLMESEEEFALLYGNTGRPNFSVARMLGICILQEIRNQSDQEALDCFCFDVRWRHALDASEEAYLSRRSLVEFRRRLAEQDPDMTLIRKVFERISRSAISDIGLSTSEQRLDSTHVVSNIRTHSLLDLFRSTIIHFLKSLKESQFERVPGRIRKWHSQEPDGWFGLGPSERREKLDRIAPYVQQLIRVFEKDEEVTEKEPYQLLVRLFEEYCEIVDEDDTKTGTKRRKKGKKGKAKPRRRKTIKIKKSLKGAKLQSPYDPDVTYGHKGQGYSAHITETCNNDKACEIITDYEVHGAARSDVAKTGGVLDRLEGAELAPKTIFADGGYPSVPSTPDILERIDFHAPVHRGKLDDEVMGRDRFAFNEEGHVIACPEGHQPIDHRMLNSNGEGRSLNAIFDGDTCRACTELERCIVRAPNHRDKGCDQRNTVGHFRVDIKSSLRIRDEMFANQQAEEWKERYRIRAGIEATMSELKRSHGLGCLRVRRLPKVHFAISCKVIACNVKRWAKALSGCPNGILGLTECTKMALERFFPSNDSRFGFCESMAA